MLKADTAWNIDCHMAVPAESYTWENLMYRITAPSPSQMMLKNAMPMSKETRPPSFSTPMDSPMSSFSRKPTLRPKASKSKVALAMKPKPPTCISTSRTACPNGLKVVPTSGNTLSPVTHVADVDMNRASGKLVQVWARDEIGSMSSTAPMAIMTANPQMSTATEIDLNLGTRTRARGIRQGSTRGTRKILSPSF